MASRAFLGVMVIVGASALMVGQAVSQKDEGKGEAQAPSGEQAAMLQKWMEMGAPGDGHKHLEPFVGSWTTTSRFWMGGPGTPPAESTGVSEVKWIMGGRFLQEETRGSMMGMPHSGLGITGYDNFKKKYVCMWIDNSATAMYLAEGTRDPRDGTFRFFGPMDEFMTGEHDKTIKYVHRLINKDEHLFEMYDLAAGDSFKVAEIRYVRKK